jgi:hypothetical protein
MEDSFELKELVGPVLLGEVAVSGNVEPVGL